MLPFNSPAILSGADFFYLHLNYITMPETSDMVDKFIKYSNILDRVTVQAGTFIETVLKNPEIQENSELRRMADSIAEDMIKLAKTIRHMIAE